MDALQFVQGLGWIGTCGSDELQQRLRVVGSDLRVGQGRAQRLRVRGQRQLAIRVDAQALALNAV